MIHDGYICTFDINNLHSLLIANKICLNPFHSNYNNNNINQVTTGRVHSVKYPGSHGTTHFTI